MRPTETTKKKTAPDAGNATTLALIPAHNEAGLLGEFQRSEYERSTREIGRRGYSAALTEDFAITLDLIDVMELIGDHPRRGHAAVHGPGPHLEPGIGGGFRAHRPLSGRYHVYAARWSRRAVRFSVDGRTFETVRRRTYPRRDKWVFDHPMFLILNLAVGGDWPGPPGPRTRFPARLRVDWVRVWH